ncbi:MAG: HAD-IIIA family hydrolase [Nanoarchaeota archaeon]|nr:HAD-IIIA family hydrolase [Nanoarchaeota archaeon]MBU1320866.1 HAD-IIIA family hydrolase [Nanoarchaeota archaeon]MBU1597772.1 HAD-IIIA family hydrolase [Nanoarchaeota archaeon]MBU2441223.1 HAD-IIIA family hydrolase [Nanoarchaeota archaeon]
MTLKISKEIEKRYTSNKILGYPSAIKKISELKKQGKKVGLCHGGFDLLHPGHMKHFESAKKLCDYLVVSITSDQYVTSRKGSGRPVLPDNLRAYSATCVEFVDCVVISDFKKGIEVIKKLNPSYYIKGPDFIHKTTPGITAEREAIKEVGGEMKYTNDPAFSTTEIIHYVKEELDRKKILLLIDRDGTIIEDRDFLGKNKNWREEVKDNKPVVDFLSYLQTKYETTKIVVTNQAGVARKYFDCKTVEESNECANAILKRRGVVIDNWQYCPDVDSAYAEIKRKKEGFEFDPKFVKEKTKRKPSPDMVFDGLKEINKNINEFTDILVLGDKDDDKGLAKNLGGKFIAVNNKSYNELIKDFESS